MMKILGAILLLGSITLFAQDEADSTIAEDAVVLDTAEVQIDSSAIVAEDQFAPRLGDVSDGSRAVPVHLIPIYDEMGIRLLPISS